MRAGHRGKFDKGCMMHGVTLDVMSNFPFIFMSNLIQAGLSIRASSRPKPLTS